MGDEFFRISTVTGKSYDVFKTIKIRNMNQAGAYMENDVFPVDIKIERTSDNKRCLVFYFYKEETKDVYDRWCKYELD